MTNIPAEYIVVALLVTRNHPVNELNDYLTSFADLVADRIQKNALVS